MVCVVDLTHLPSLLPGAAEVDVMFSLKELMKAPIDRKAWLFAYSVKATLGPIIYMSALLYRWNIKASAMIWGPLAWALRPAVWLDDEDMRSQISAWTTWGFLSFAAPAISALYFWLLLPFTAPDWLAEAPSWLKIFASHWPAPVFTFRYLMLSLLVASLAILWLSAYRIRAAHAKALEGAGDFHRGYDEPYKVYLRIMAHAVRSRLQWTTAIAAMTVWSIALWLALQRWPNELPHVVWDWLRPWL